MGSDGSRQSIANQLECQTLQIRLQQPRNQSSRRETSLPARGATRSLSLVRFLVARCVATARLPRGPNRGWLPLAHGRYFPILASLGSAAKQTKQPMSIEHKASTSPTPPLVIALLPKYLCFPAHQSQWLPSSSPKSATRLTVAPSGSWMLESSVSGHSRSLQETCRTPRFAYYQRRSNAEWQTQLRPVFLCPLPERPSNDAQGWICRDRVPRIQPRIVAAPS